MQIRIEGEEPRDAGSDIARKSNASQFPIQLCFERRVVRVHLNREAAAVGPHLEGRTRTFHVIAQSQLHRQVAQVELGQRLRQTVLPEGLQARERGIAGEGEGPLPRFREGKIVWKPEVRFHRSPAPGLRTPTEPSSIREARNWHKELFRRMTGTSVVLRRQPTG